ncbi:restriction endonuclease subunit S [Staphylococcus epidermidis]|nr:restriction endonuclease subunit S [Staphylococcus epidermidis]
MTEQINTPELRFPEFKEEWIEYYLGNNAMIKGRLGWKGLKQSEYLNNGYAYLIANKHIKNGRINWEETDQINKFRYDESPEIALETGDLIFSKDGALGNPALIKNLPKPASINSTMMLVRLNKINFIPNFFYQILLGPLFNKLIYLKVSGSSIPHLFQADMKDFKFKAPSLPEQEKIGNFFSKLDQQIELEEKKLELLEQQKRGYMQKIFSQELRFKDENGNEYPEWEEKTIKDVYKVTRGYVLARKLMSDNPNSINKYPVYSSQTSNNGLMGYYSDYLYQDAITWTTDGANAGSVSFRQGKFYCTNVCGVLLNELGNSNVCMAEMLNNIAFKYVSKVGNPKLMNNVMAMIKLKFPCLEEQQAISKFLNVFSEVIDNQNKKVELLKERKKGLLQKMFV